jgi:ABC-type multidrug transport system permease subunit
MARLGELKELTRARILLFVREPEAMFWVFMFPMILALVLGYAFRDQGVEQSIVAMLEGSDTTEVRAALEGTDGIRLVDYDDREEAERALERGTVDAVVLGGEPPAFRFDPDRKEGVLARLRVLEALGDRSVAGGDSLQEIEAEGTGTRYIDWLFPGLLGMNLMGTGIWSIAFGIADQRQKKLLKRLLVTPMRRSSFLMSFATSRFAFLMLEVGGLMAFGVWILGVPMEGSVVDFTVLCVVGGMCFASLGILCASRVRTIEGISGLLNFVMMPMWLGSGVFFNYERFPEFLHPFLKALPLTALNDSLRLVMLDGAGLAECLPELFVMVVWSVASFVVALRIFRWE